MSISVICGLSPNSVIPLREGLKMSLRPFQIHYCKDQEKIESIDEEWLRELKIVIVELRDIDAKKFVDVTLVGQFEILITLLH